MDRLTYTRMMAQIPLDAAADRIQSAAARPGLGHDGFFDTWVDDDQHAVTVYWHGAMPADIVALVQSLRRTVTVHVATARYGMAALKAAIHRGMSVPGVVSGKPRSDGSGVEFDVDEHETGMAIAAGGLSGLRLGVPVDTAPGSSDPVTTAAQPNRAHRATTTPPSSGPVCLANPALPLRPDPSRCADSAPFWGGDILINSMSLTACTSAFGVHDRSTGATYLVTAAHCSKLNNVPVDGIEMFGGSSVSPPLIGVTSQVPGPHDAALIATDAGNRYYDGPGVDGGDTSGSKGVVGQAGVSVNDLLCVSGGMTGIICGVRVDATGVVEGNWTDLAEATSASNSVTVSGDSGSPYFSLAGTGVVEARGVHHGVVTSPGGTRYLRFTPMDVVTNDTNCVVNT
jgi:hypothetical protein